MALINPLHAFSTFNTIFTLSVLTANEVNSPNSTYKIREPSNVLLRSGGGATNKTTTYYEDRLGIKLEYFIDNVNIESLVTNNSTTRSSNATSVNFEVVEPYSMGLFLQTLAIAAKEAYGNEYVNYLDTPYLLTIEFIGYDDNGNSVVEADSIAIIFPTSVSSTNNLGTLQATQIGAAQFIDVDNPGVPGAVISGFQTGILDSGVGQNTIDPSIKNYVDNFVATQGTQFGVAESIGLNDFGAAKIIDGFSEAGKSPMPTEGSKYKSYKNYRRCYIKQ
jgi:hypothetical protein